MPDYNFTATARIPTRPLSYENKDLAEAKELIVNYKTGQVFVCTEDKTIVDITSSVTTVVEEVIKEIQKDPSSIESAVKDTEITLPSGTTVTIEAGLLDALAKLEELQKSLGYTKDSDGNITLKIPAKDVVTTDDMQFTSKTEKSNWNEKTAISPIALTILGGESNWTAVEDNGNTYYTQTVSTGSVAITPSNCNPIVDIKLSDAYETAMNEIKNYAYIYRIDTDSNSIKVYATEMTNIDINIIMLIYSPKLV